MDDVMGNFEQRRDLVVRRIGDELLAYDPVTAKTHALNGTAAMVFDAVSSGGDRRAVEAAVEGLLGTDADVAVVVELALDELVDAGLVVASSPLKPASPAERNERRDFDRRRMLKLAAAGSAGAIAIPVVTSIVAPSIAAAQSAGNGGGNGGGPTTTAAPATTVAPTTTAAPETTTTTVAPAPGDVSTFAGGSGSPLANVASVVFGDGAGYIISGNTILKVNQSTGAIVSTISVPAGELNNPQGMTYVGGFLYVADTGNHRIAKINVSTGALENFSGTKGTAGYAFEQSPGASKGLYSSPTAIVAAGGTTFYIADRDNHAVRRVVGGSSGGFVGQFNLPGYQSGRLRSPSDLAVGPDGKLYVADSGNNVIRAIDIPGTTITTYAGPASVGGAAAPTGNNDGAAASARFNAPTGISFGPGGVLYVSDSGNSRVRKISSGIVSTLAGASGELSNPRYITVDAGSVFVADKGNGRVAKIVA